MEILKRISRVVEASSNHMLMFGVALVEMEFFSIELDLVVKLHEFLQRSLLLVLYDKSFEPQF